VVQIVHGFISNKTKIFDLDIQVRRDGPDLPIRMSRGASVQFGDTFLVVSSLETYESGIGYIYSKSIFKFVTEPEGWFELPQKLSVGSDYFNAFLVPKDFIDCN
jgi:hypothetical protein